MDAFSAFVILQVQDLVKAIHPEMRRHGWHAVVVAVGLGNNIADEEEKRRQTKTERA